MAERNEEFSSFDVVSDDSDHYFIRRHNSCIGENCFTNTKSKVYKSIMKEWKILERNLPESIYVRVYERHINLMRAVIIGVPGTPYHDGLFFCDIAFPQDYPNNPPKVYFHSFGSKVLNPNIYHNGTICISLLNNTAGKKGEMWDPCSSTLLQVLLSIQALILTEKPLLNIFGSNAITRTFLDSMSRAYNEKIFIDTCRISFNIIRQPPKNFEDFVTYHFQRRGFAILSVCNAYSKGLVRVGYYGCDPKSTTTLSYNKKRSSGKSFGVELGKFYDNLYDAFEKCGASLGPSVQHLEMKTKQHRSQSFNKVLGKIKHAFGWNGMEE